MAPERAPCANAGARDAAPCARLANSAQPPMARKANATWTAVARASLARDHCAVSGPAIRFELLPGWSPPPVALPLLWGLGVVIALCTAGALAAALLPRLRP